MVIRTTTTATSDSLLNYIWANQASYNSISEQVATQKKINKPSDNPTDAISLLNVNKQLSQQNAYLDNMSLASNQLSVMDNNFASMISDLQRAHDLAVTASNGTTSVDSLKSIKSEVDQIIKNMVDVGNTQYNGSYIFAGTDTSKAPFTQDIDPASPTYGSITYLGNQNQNSVEISDGVKTAINIAGDKLLGTYDSTTKTGTGVMGVLNDFSNALATNPPDYDTIRNQLDRIQSCINDNSNTRTNFASITQRFTMTKNSVNANILQLKSYKSELDDVDVSEAATDLAQQKYALEATMAVATQSLQQTSLLNYLK